MNFTVSVVQSEMIPLGCVRSGQHTAQNSRKEEEEEEE